jgi:hypothetical protein
MYTFLKYYARQIYSCSFHISKLRELRVIHDLYFQYLTQTFFKVTLFTKPEGVGRFSWCDVAG